MSRRALERCRAEWPCYCLVMLLFAWIWLLITIFGDLFRDHELSGWGRPSGLSSSSSYLGSAPRSAALATEAVLKNLVVVGSVNVNRRHYYRAAKALAAGDHGWLAQLVTRRVGLEQVQAGLQRAPEDIKVIVETFTAGLAMLAVTLAGGVLLVLDVAVGSWFAVPVAFAALLLLLALWYLLPLPLLRRSRLNPSRATSCNHGVQDEPVPRLLRILVVSVGFFRS